MKDYIITIYSQSYNLYKDLKRYEPKLNKEKHCIVIKDLDTNTVKKIKSYCTSKGVRYNISNNNYERGSSYRRTFFNTYEPINNHYFCAYCGKYIPKEEITVDHIIPVAYAKNNIAKQKILTKLGIKNINDAKNLTPSCRSCNSRKGTKTVGWVYRGKLGRNKYFWYFFHSISFITLNTFIYCLFSLVF